MKVKSTKLKKGCAGKQSESLRTKTVSWVPQSNKDLGALINGRYFVMNKSDKNDCWISFDMKKGKECLIREFSAQYFDESDYEEGLEPIACQLGDTLKDRYYVLKMICRTTLSTIWLTFDIQKRRERVVKVSSTYKIMMHEIDVMKTIRKHSNMHSLMTNCDHFVEILSSGKRNSCLVMEEMAEDLFMFRDKFKTSSHMLPLNLVKQITRQILIGLDNLHKCGIIHADMKLENVLVTQCSLENKRRCPDRNKKCDKIHIKLIDFGNSLYTNQTQIAEGHTLRYSCPEVIIGLALETSADICSTALLVFELLAGRSLIIREEDEPKLAHLRGFTEFIGNIPKEVLKRAKYADDYYDENGNLRDSWYPFSLQELCYDWNWPQSFVEPLVSFLIPMLNWDPLKRATAAECLQHSWLS